MDKPKPKTSPRVLARNRGAAFERRVAKFLKDKLGWEIERNLNQSRRGGDDLVSKPGKKSAADRFSIECKCQAKVSLTAAWRQTFEQAGTKIPVLAFSTGGEPRRWAFSLSDLNIFVPAAKCKGVKVDGSAYTLAILTDAEALKVFSHHC